jgi:hypothetical protein
MHTPPVLGGARGGGYATVPGRACRSSRSASTCFSFTYCYPILYFLYLLQSHTCYALVLLAAPPHVCDFSDESCMRECSSYMHAWHYMAQVWHDATYTVSSMSVHASTTGSLPQPSCSRSCMCDMRRGSCMCDQRGSLQMYVLMYVRLEGLIARAPHGSASLQERHMAAPHCRCPSSVSLSMSMQPI